MPPKKEFSIDAPAILCTWIVQGFTKEQIVENFKLLGKRGLIAVAKEKTKNDRDHFHVFIKNLDSTSWKMKDLDALTGHHGHYCPVRRTPDNCLAYVCKDGDYIAYPATYHEHCEKAVASAVAFHSHHGEFYKTNWKVAPSRGPLNKNKQALIIQEAKEFI